MFQLDSNNFFSLLSFVTYNPDDLREYLISILNDIAMCFHF